MTGETTGTTTGDLTPGILSFGQGPMDVYVEKETRRHPTTRGPKTGL